MITAQGFVWSITSDVPIQPINSWLISILKFIDQMIPRIGPLHIIPNIGGDLYQFSDKGLFRFITDLWTQSNGCKYIDIRFAHRYIKIIFDAELSKEILLSKNVGRGFMYDRLTEFFGFGIFTSKIKSRWFHQRKMIINLLSGKNLQEITPKLTQSMFDALDKRIENKTVDDLVCLLSVIGLIGFCETFFGVNIDDMAENLIDPLNQLLIYINGAAEPFLITFDPAYKKFVKDKNFVHDWMRKLIERAKHSHTCHPLIKQEIDRNQLFDDELINDELIEFILSIVLGGHETTARLMLGIIYSLYYDQKLIKQMNEETKHYCLKHPQYEIDILEQPYINNIIKEGTRLFPPVWILGRESKEDLIFQGIVLKKNTQMLISPLIFLRSTQIWGNDAEVFNPNRFNQLSEKQKKLFIPFIVGPESCPGKKFAELEAAIVITKLFYDYDIHFLEHKLNPSSAGTFRLTDNLPITIHKKSTSD